METFQSFCENRDFENEIGFAILELQESAGEGFWDEIAIPVLQEGNYETVDDLMEGIFDRFKNWGRKRGPEVIGQDEKEASNARMGTPYARNPRFGPEEYKGIPVGPSTSQSRANFGYSQGAQSARDTMWGDEMDKYGPKAQAAAMNARRIKEAIVKGKKNFDEALRSIKNGLGTIVSELDRRNRNKFQKNKASQNVFQTFMDAITKFANQYSQEYDPHQHATVPQPGDPGYATADRTADDYTSDYNARRKATQQSRELRNSYPGRDLGTMSNRAI